MRRVQIQKRPPRRVRRRLADLREEPLRLDSLTEKRDRLREKIDGLLAELDRVIDEAA